ncbi:hypothetical protein AAIB33_07750 [Microbacterium sp. AZCO]|uniref:hypothetical protein n=1 Tax=Microbacterium sp. AZCO TaxID=3142976 RepID=UPI0031F3E689
MKTNEIVWRTLADAALAGRREWPDLSTLAAAVDAPISSTHQALGRLVDIGAVQTRHRGGIVVVSPERVVLTMAANRNLIRDTVTISTLSAAQDLTGQHPSAISFGGTDAAVHWLGGENTVADKGVRLIYADADVAVDLPDGDEVRVVSRDRVAARAWRDGFSSVAQTYADLFATPGWQAGEFRLALHARLFEHADWEQSPGEAHG